MLIFMVIVYNCRVDIMLQGENLSYKIIHFGPPPSLDTLCFKSPYNKKLLAFNSSHFLIYIF